MSPTLPRGGPQHRALITFFADSGASVNFFKSSFANERGPSPAGSAPIASRTWVGITPS